MLTLMLRNAIASLPSGGKGHHVSLDGLNLRKHGRNLNDPADTYITLHLRISIVV